MSANEPYADVPASERCPPLSEHRLRRRVQFYEVDGAGIVHFSWFFRYMEEAEHALWREAGLTIAPTGEFVFPRIAASFEFKRPLRFEDECDVIIRVVDIRTKTMSYTCVLKLASDVVAIGRMTTACVSVAPGDGMKASAFPPNIIARFSVAPTQVDT
jgi:YbgC/YbaW family acyl-CoA thioester hydrolase